MGAVTGAHDFLKIVTMAKINPPIAPPNTRGTDSVGAFRNRFQLQAAVATAQINSTPVLLAVPCTVIASPKATPSPRNAFSFKAGLAVLINCAIGQLHSCFCYRCQINFSLKDA